MNSSSMLAVRTTGEKVCAIATTRAEYLPYSRSRAGR
jgi:hypothetical protein